MNGAPAERTPRSFAFGPFVLIPERQLLLRDEEPVRIGSRALDLLTALVERPGALVSKGELFSRAWPDTVVEEGNLKVNMAALRRTLGEEPGKAQYIATVTGRGYRFVATVRTAEKGDPALASTGTAAWSHGLPAGRMRIFGRADAIDTIRRDLAESRIVSIVGPGGIGKTSVAITVAREHADHVAFIDLARIGDAQFVPAAIASALGLGMTGGDPLASIVHALKFQQKVLLFDSCEHLLPAVAAAVDRLARDLGGVRILATSREPLRIRHECVHRLRGLECDPRESPTADEARRFPAVDLFATRASERAGYQLTDADAPAVAEICRRLDGNPLAIELAATQTAAFPLAQILQLLDDRFRILKLGPPGAPLRQQSLLATLDWSYSLLPQREAALLRAVCVFAGAFSIDGATAVSPGAAAEVLDTLAQLAAKSLLTMDTNGDVITYRLLETTRAYGLERLRVSGEEQVIRRLHAEHVCTVLERATSEWAERPAPEWAAAYGRFLDDLRSALTWARQDAANRSRCIRLTLAAILLWNHFSLTEECRVHVSRAVEELDAAGLAGTAFEMKLKVWLGGATMFTRGLETQALDAMQRALDIAVQIGDADCRVRCLRLIGVYELFTGENDAAIRTLETFASVAAAEVPSAVLEAETALGIGELFVGRLQSVRQRFEHRHELDLRNINETQRLRYHVRYLSDRIVDVGNVLSHIQWLTGSVDTALRTARAQVAYARKTEHSLSLSNALSWVSPVFYWTGRYEECGRYVKMLDDEARRHGFDVRRPVAMFYRAALACTQKDASADEIGAIERAIAEFQATRHLARMPFYLGVLAECLTRQGRHCDAEITIRTALDRASAKNDRWCSPELVRIQASILLAQGHADAAEALLIESMALAQGIGALSWRLRAATDLAKLWRVQSRADDARKLLLPIYNEFSEGFETRDLAAAGELLALLARRGVGDAV